MTFFRNVRKAFAATAAIALTLGIIASASPAHAKYYCSWTPRGNVCSYVP